MPPPLTLYLVQRLGAAQSVSHTIAKFLGLNTELTKSIAVGHDIGHAPFGHFGETVIKDLSKKHVNKEFWHEKNGLRFVDSIELMEDDKRRYHNLCLTYAVRDGIISHCGEIDENGLMPRKEFINLYDFNVAGEHQPITWEGCVVKLADKIAYVGRDIEDAISLRFIPQNELYRLARIARSYGHKTINTTVIMHSLITDLCENSTPQTGLILSEKNIAMLNEIKAYNTTVIYHSPRLESFKDYARIVLERVFYTLLDAYKKEDTIYEIRKRSKIYPALMKGFSEWIVLYCDFDYKDVRWANSRSTRSVNRKIYKSLDTIETYAQAILDYIAGMTDRYAIKMFNELIEYKH
jgi:dGTPase